MLVDNENTLNRIFANTEMLVATHCESEQRIRARSADAKEKFGDHVPPSYHPVIRDEEACYLSSSEAVHLSEKHGTRLHILHISTAKELSLFTNTLPLSQKKITAEACIHHLWFCDEDYERLGNLIKWNPAIKSRHDRESILNAVLDDRIDVIATDHAPHTLEEKSRNYWNAPSGGPLVQHALPAMLDLYHSKKISLEQIVRKMAHSVAECFKIRDRGFIREGYFADLAIVDLNRETVVNKEQLLYKCKWSPFEGHTFRSSVVHTIVNGLLVYSNGSFNDEHKGRRMEFNR
jgi:dihydroorotase